jgi:pseudaminic acid cytidylyltransferase
MGEGILCVIPARGGSKRIPRKNLREFYGCPILQYAIELARRSGIFAEVMVSTEDAEIAGAAKAAGAEVPFLRSGETSGDDATTVGVWKEVLQEYAKRQRQFALVISILPTAVFVREEDLHRAVELMEANPDWDGLMPVVEYAPPVQRAMEIREGRLEMVWPEFRTARSQDLVRRYYDAGQYYAFRPDFIARVNSLREGRLGPVIVSADAVQDIDTEEDWKRAEVKYRTLKESRGDAVREGE